ncbi:membrane protein of unknown function [Candidatus Promineifilum breve]|uniref:Uncharacterized protein n=1 Tax=Candidatus Promineifilum breve TaxID=1806508 RepID=A0A160T132_9CHLR|nr:DUF308 domain-containing protein [Candidatus Promineifilum breve]CUS03701.2 membrane protein of unknown function [Candidatus Promineifilum breve]
MATKKSSSKAVSANPNAWIWTLVRGIFALGLGLYLLLDAQTAPIFVAYALAIYLTVAGAIQTFMSLLNRGTPGSTTDRVRGLVGLIGGGALLLLAYFDVLSISAAYTLLAVLLIAYGALGLFEMLFARGNERFQIMPLIINLLLAALGVLVFYFRARELGDLRVWAGAVLALIGLGLIAFGYMVQKRNPTAGVE